MIPSIEDVWSLIDKEVAPLPAESVPLAMADGRVLREPARAAVDLPPFDQSAVDGYALGTPTNAPLRVRGTFHAGDAAPVALAEGETWRVLTGAPLPQGTRAMAREEDVLRDDAHITPPELPDGSDIRRRGEVFHAGDPLVTAGTSLPPGATALLATAGLANASVTRQPGILHLVSGEELQPPGAPLAPGMIHDSNSPLIAGLLHADGHPVEQHRLGDRRDDLLKAAGKDSPDLLLISGGAGLSERDHARSVLEELGFTIHSSRVNSRPGKPLIFATKGPRVAFGLPGNPLSHFVCYQVFVRRAMARLAGSPPAPLYKARLTAPPSDTGDGRWSWMPAMAQLSDSGLQCTLLPWRNSADLTPLVTANALALIPATGCTGKQDIEILPTTPTFPAA